MKKSTVRLNLTLSVEAKRQLEKLKKETKADTLTEVIRKAIKLYDVAMQCEKNGEQLVLKSDKGEKKILVL